MGIREHRLTNLLLCLSFLLSLAACGSFQNGDPYEGFGSTEGETNNGIIVDEPERSDGGGGQEPVLGGGDVLDRVCTVAQESTSEIRSIRFFVENLDFPEKQFIQIERLKTDGNYLINVEWTSPTFNLDYGLLVIEADFDLHSVMSEDSQTTISYSIDGVQEDTVMDCVIPE